MWSILQVSSIIAARLRFVDSDFAVSIVVDEEDFEDSDHHLLAPSVQSNAPNIYIDNYFPGNYKKMKIQISWNWQY